MSSSIKLFSVRGIDIRLHITFPLILILAGFQFGLISGAFTGAVFGVAAVSVLFVLVTLHELGHSFAAQYYGVHVKQIVLSPIGGVAQLAEMPDKPVQELVIAAAGPAVNFLFALLAVPFIALFNINLFGLTETLRGAGSFGLEALFSYVFVSNIFLALFNLLPAFPLDGGRILRAGLALRLDYARATQIASTIGRIMAVGFGIYGLLNGSIFLALIAVFIFGAAGQEAKYAQARSTLRRYTVGQVYSPGAYRLEPDDTLQQAARLMVLGRQGSFAVVWGSALMGFLPQGDLMRSLQTKHLLSPVSASMRTDIAAVSSEDDLYTAQKRMMEQQVEALPVVDAGRYLGVVSWQQIEKLLHLSQVAPQAAPGVQTA